ncbi:two-component system sensor histidine kinase VicK [Pedobacter sp. UYEF25]
MPNNVTPLIDKQLLEILALSKDPTAIFINDQLRVAFVNDAMLAFWDKSRDVTGSNLDEIMPEFIDQGFISILRNVWQTGVSYKAQDQAAELYLNGALQTRYFDFIYKSLKNEDGKTYAILNTATEVTDRVLALALIKDKDKIEKDLLKQLFAANEEYRATNEELRISNEELSLLRKEMETVNQLLKVSNTGLQEENNKLTTSEKKALAIFSDAPIAMGIFSGAEMRIESANQKLLEICGRPAFVIGMRLADAIPELKGQRFLQALDDVFQQGLASSLTDERVVLIRDGAMTEGYFNFIYHPIKDRSGQTESIMLVANEVTEQVLAKQTVQSLNENLAGINEELIATNEEVSFANEYAKSANHRLTLVNEKLSASRKQVIEAEQFLRQAIEAANIGTWNLNIHTGKLMTSRRLKELFGFLETDDPTLSECIAQISPEYQNIMTQEADSSLPSGGDYDLSYSVIGFRDQKTRWVRAVGHLSVDSEGNIYTFAGVVMDITGQKQDEQIKNDFISMVSHELKTPLTSLMAYIQMLQIVLKTATDVRVVDMLKRSRSQVTRMNKIITGFLDVSRFDGGKLYIQASNFSLQQLIVEIIDEVIITSTTHKIIFESKEDVLVNADRDKIGQVIQNLISNALKYSPHGKDIEISYQLKDKMAKVSFKDHGMGVRAEDLDKLFNRFYRIKNNRTKTIAGFGIGLYLCAEIIKRHKGQIWVESDGFSGSTFHFSIPIFRL